MTAQRLVQTAGALALACWLGGVAGWLGTSPTVNWTLFLGGIALVASAAVLPGRE